MRWRWPHWSRWAAWLGVVALGLNALVPVHLAFDLAAALAPAHHNAAGLAGDAPGRQLLALLCGHDEEGGAGDRHGHNDNHRHGTACPVCSAAGTLLALAMPAAAMLPIPAAIAPALDATPAAAAPLRAPPTAYRSRAPPLA